MKRPTRFRAGAGVIAALACAGGGIASGANAPATSGGDQLEEVVVTAEKTSEEAYKTPIALSVFSPDQLAQAGVNSIDTLTMAPSLEVTTSNHGPLLTLRGVTTTDTTSKGTVAVLFNQDGITIGRNEITQVAMFDLDRVEVLRGPQGTLYGESSTGGAVNVISARPVDKFDASASVDFGNYNARREQAMINVPLTDNLIIRLAGASNIREGYLNPVLYFTPGAPGLSNSTTLPISSQAPLDAENNVNGRLTVLYKFGDLGDVLVHATAGHLGGTGDVSNSALYDRYSDGNSYAQQVYYNPMAGGVDDQYSKYDGELNLNLGAVHLTYVAGYLKFSGTDNFAPSDGEPQGTTPTYNWNNYNSDNNYISHEVRLSNAQPQRLEYVVGANFWREQTDEVDNNWSTYVSPNPAAGCNFSAPNTEPYCNTPGPNIVAQNQHETKGIFGQGTLHVNDQFKIEAGLRYSSDSMFRHGSFAAGNPPGNINGFPTFADINGNPCHPGDSCVPLSNGTSGTRILNDFGGEASSKVTWRLEADYQVATNQMVYGYVATGYKGGSFNDVCPGNNGAPCSYGPENMTAFELGYKGRITPTFEVDTDFYYYDYSKYQLTVPTFLAQSVNGGATQPAVIIYTKIVPLTLFGWEGEVHWNVTKDDLFNVSATVENGYYGPGTTVGFDGNLPPVNWAGKRMDNLPPVVVQGSYEHHFILSDGGYLSARIGEKLSGGYYESNLGGSVQGAPPFCGPLAPAAIEDVPPCSLPFFQNPHYDPAPMHFYQKPFTQTNLNLGYSSASGKFIVDAYVRNLENKMQMAGAPNGINGPGITINDSVTVAVTPPRTLGVRLGWKL